MAKLPSVLVDINCFFDDESFAGVANTMTLPKIVTKTIDMVMSGVAGDMARDIGRLEKLECEVTISDYAPRIMGLVGSRDSREEVFVARGAVDVEGTIRTVVVRQQGFWRELEFNEWAPEKEATNKFAINVEMFEVELDGREVIHIDKLNNIFRINGVDRNQSIRDALAQ